MECRNCGKELPKDVLLCEECGFDNAAPEVKVRNPWKYIFPAVVCVALLAVLGWMIYFGVTGSFLPKANDVYVKNNYTVDDDRALANRNNVVATMGEHKLTSGLLQVFYGNRVISYLDNYGAAFDYTKSLHDQIYDKATGLTWQQFFLEDALNTWRYYMVLCDMARADGFELPEEYRAVLDSSRDSIEAQAKEQGMESADALVQADMGSGCTVDDYLAYLEIYYLGQLYYTRLTEDMEFPMEQIEAYFEENESAFAESGITKDFGKLVDVRHILIKPTGDKVDGAYTPEQWTVAKDQAEGILADFLEGEKTDEAFAELAKKHSQDSKTASGGGLLYGMPRHYLSTVDVRHILIMPGTNTNTTYTDAEWAEAEKKAQDIYDQYLAGEMTEEAFAALAIKHSQDGNASSGGIYNNVTKGYMVDTFDAWIFDSARQVGDTGIVKTQFGYHIMYYVGGDRDADDWCFDEARAAGETAVIQSEDGYHVFYFVYGEEAWIRVSQQALSSAHGDTLVNAKVEEQEMNVQYISITLGNSDLG